MTDRDVLLRAATRSDPLPYRPYETSPEQDAVLDAIEARARPGTVAVLDLDGCLFDTRHRQVHILRAFAERTGDWALARVTADHFADRDLEATLLAAGVAPDRARALSPALGPFWAERFFDDEHVACDLPLPASTRLAGRLHAAGAHVVYLTGRLAGMRPATERALSRFGFPYGGERATLLTKADAAVPDHAYKAGALDRIAALGEVVVALDNEPENVNLLAERFPGALVVLVETDASSSGPREDLPRIRGFLRTDDVR